MLEKVITKKALIYFTQQLYTKISNNFARKGHTHTSLANKEHNHNSNEISLNDGRKLEDAFNELENKINFANEIILTSKNGVSYKLEIDDKGVIHTTKITDI